MQIRLLLLLLLLSLLLLFLLQRFILKISKCHFETTCELFFQGDQGIGTKGEPGKPGQTGAPGTPGPPGGFLSPPMKVSLIPSRTFAEQNFATRSVDRHFFDSLPKHCPYPFLYKFKKEKITKIRFDNLLLSLSSEKFHLLAYEWRCLQNFLDNPRFNFTFCLTPLFNYITFIYCTMYL